MHMGTFLMLFLCLSKFMYCSGMAPLMPAIRNLPELPVHHGNILTVGMWSFSAFTPCISILPSLSCITFTQEHMYLSMSPHHSPTGQRPWLYLHCLAQCLSTRTWPRNASWLNVWSCGEQELKGKVGESNIHVLYSLWHFYLEPGR